jgi:membrane protein
MTDFVEKIRSTVSASAPVEFLRRKSKLIILPGFRGIPLYDVVKFFWGQVMTTGMTERASAVAFNFVMAIPPMIIFIFTLIPFLPISKQFEYELYGLIRDVIPGERNNASIIKFLQDFINNPRNGLLSLGFLLSAFFSSNAMIGIMRSFDQNYVGFKKRGEIQTRLVALKMILVIYVLLIMCILMMIAQGAVLKFIGIKDAPTRILIDYFRWIVIIILFQVIISYIYRNAPAVHKKWKMLNPGSILATILMLLCTVMFSWYVTNFGNYNQLYGSIGTILILMILIYFNSLVLLIGFELNVSIAALKRIADERNNNLPDGSAEST